MAGLDSTILGKRGAADIALCNELSPDVESAGHMSSTSGLK